MELLSKLSYLFDSEDKKKFIKFVFLLAVGGIISLLGIGAVIPFVNLLLQPDKLHEFPVLENLSYQQALSLSIFALILAFWIKNAVALFILRTQSIFLSGLSAKIQKKLFKMYMAAPYKYHIKKSSPEIISTINIEANTLSQNIIAQVGNVLNESITSFVVFVALLFISPLMTLLITGSLILSARVFVLKLRNKAGFYGKQRASSYVSLSKSVMQSLGSVKETKIYGKESYFIDEVDESSARLAYSASFSNIFQQSPRLLIESIAITVIMISLYFMAMTSQGGESIFILMSVFGIASIQLLPSMNRLMQSLSIIRYSYPALDKIYHEVKSIEEELLSAQIDEEVDQDPVSFLSQLKLFGIQFKYGAQGENILSDVSITIKKGSKVAFVGPSGAGKTTLADIILGVLDPCSGEIFIDDSLLKRKQKVSWQKHFGYIPQLIYIYDSNIRENIAFGVEECDISDERVWECLAEASLDKFVDSLPEKLDSKVGENGVTLSGGQRQRIGIARALYNSPDILVMDEATAALDNQTEREVTAALSRASQDRTIITIAHRLSTIKTYDLIYLLDKGRVVASGKYSELIDKSKLFKDMVNAAEKE